MSQNGTKYMDTSAAGGTGGFSVLNTYFFPNLHRIHYAWVICIACTLMIYCNSGITDGMLSVYEPYIIESFGISNTQMSLMLTVKAITSLLAVVFSGIFYKKLSLRLGSLISIILCGSSFVIFAFAKSFLLFLTASVILGIGNGIGTNIPVSTLYGLWFAKKRKLAMSISTFAGSIGLIGLPQLITHIIEGRSMQAAFLLNAGIVFAVMLIVISIMRNSPEEMDLRPYGYTPDATHNDNNEQSDNSCSDKELTSRDWLLLAPAGVAIGIICCTSYSFFTLFLKNECISAHTIAALLTLTGLSVGSGKLSYGYISDKFGSYICNRIYFVSLISGIGLLTFGVRSVYALFPATILMGFGSPLGSIGFVSWAWDLGGHGSAEAIRKMQIALYIGMMTFNFIPGIVADLNNGSYRSMYIFYTLLGIPTFIAIQHLYRSKGLAKK